jgi:hypothetical protein
VSPSKIVPALVALAALVSCTANKTAQSSTSTTPTFASTSSSTVAPTGASTVLPVVPCPTTFGAQPSYPFVPRQLPTAGLSRGLSFYSNGMLTILAPAGWACAALVAADGGRRLGAYPPGQRDASLTPAQPGTRVVQLDADYTGHGPGAQLVCPLFPQSPAATFLQGVSPPCPATPSGETRAHLTDDVVTFDDPSGVHGTGAGSGGSLVSIGAVVYPQVKSPEPQGGVNVAVLSCTLPNDLASLCQAIQTDFLVRYSPAFAGSPSG